MTAVILNARVATAWRWCGVLLATDGDERKSRSYVLGLQLLWGGHFDHVNIISVLKVTSFWNLIKPKTESKHVHQLLTKLKQDYSHEVGAMFDQCYTTETLYQTLGLLLQYCIESTRQFQSANKEQLNNDNEAKVKRTKEYLFIILSCKECCNLSI